VSTHFIDKIRKEDLRHPHRNCRRSILPAQIIKVHFLNVSSNKVGARQCNSFCALEFDGNIAMVALD